MSTHKHIDKICVVAVLLTLLFTVLFMNGEAFGIQPSSKAMGYENRLFDTSQVHTIDIVMDDWDDFIENCENEEYAACAVIIDGESYKNTGIRAKGNTSLRNVSSMNSDRYSFKIEFDHYDSTKSYYGLDKLSLNNIIQDTTYMKDYLTYQMMGQFDVAAPLCSYAYIRVNGEDWGLYLAVEGVEDAFLQRNYGNDYGNLYKPDSTSLGGGRGNGHDFNMEEFMPDGQRSDMPEPPSDSPEQTDNSRENIQEQPPAWSEEMDNSKDNTQESSSALPERRNNNRGGFGNGPGGMGSSDVKLQYVDDDPDSYSNIFGNAKTDITEADKTRLIQSLKALSEGSNLEKTVDIDKVIRYFVVHNFVCNGDSYTGSIIHNYYLYENNGQLSMIPWDYNLAFGTFQSSNADSMVNSPIDTPVSGGSADDRPMVDWIFNSQEYTDLYHQYFAEFVENTDFAGLIDTTYTLIASYVEKDPSKFYSYEEFETGVSVLKEFCLLRKESVEGQLAGTIPSDQEGQSQDSSALVSASHITLSDMGSMGQEHGGPDGGIRMAGGPGGGMGRNRNFQPNGQGEDSMNGNFPETSQNMPSEDPSNISDARQAWAEGGDSTLEASPSSKDSDFPDQNNGEMPQPPQEMQPPENPGDRVPDDFSPEADRTMPPREFAGSSMDGSIPYNETTWILLAVSVIVLSGGLLIAFKFQR